MKKEEIIKAYNDLLSVLKSEVEEYETLTGDRYQRKYMWGFFNSMKPDGSGLKKEDLEWYLEERMKEIEMCRNLKREFTENREVLSSEEGRAFVESLKKRRDELDRMIGGIRMKFTASFNSLLKTAGLEGWKIAGDGRTIPSGFTFFRISDGDADIDVILETRNSQVTMSLNTAVSGKEEISSRGKQYRRFKAYTTICENDGLFNGWIQGEYREMADEIAGIDSEMRKVNEDITRPYRPWMKYKELQGKK